MADAFNGGGASGGFGGFGTGGAGGGSPFEGFDFSSFTSGGGGFSSFFENLFGGGRSGRRQQGTASRSQSSSIDIPLVLALTGGDVLVNTPSGDKVKLKVKPCTQPGTKVRLPGKGQGGRDLILTYNVRLPDSLTPQQQALLRQALG